MLTYEYHKAYIILRVRSVPYEATTLYHFIYFKLFIEKLRQKK